MNIELALQKLVGNLVCILLLTMLMTGCATTPPHHNDIPTPIRDAHHTPEDSHATHSVQEQSEAIAQAAEHATDIAPTPDTPHSRGEEVALRAIGQIGKPYHYGGADPHGFDCSGLVFYIYRELGIELPRSAAAQHQSTTRISRQQLEPGDLVFFHIKRKRISHVGIYVGDNRFVHAPQTGKHVELRALDEEYYKKHFVSAGRIK
jgi:murein DD-endopeptidase